MIHVEFRSATDYLGNWKHVAKAMMPQLPLPGECISISGDPYTVESRGWAIDPDNSNDQTYAYVHVSPRYLPKKTVL